MPYNWKIWANRVSRIEAKHLPKVKRVLKDMYTDAAAAIRAGGVDAAKGDLMLLVVNPNVHSAIHGIYMDAGKFGAQWTFGSLEKYVKETPKQKAANFGRNLDWIAQVIQYLAVNFLRFAANITATTRDDILKIIEKGVEEGKGAEELAREIEASGFPLMRARVVVRTEVVRAANVGHQIGAKSLPFEVNKRWSAAKDHRTRHSHVFVNGTTVGENDTFKVPIYRGNTIVGYDNMQAPGDPKAHPSNTINCRCRAVHVPVRDANGRPVQRRTATTLTIP